MSIWILNALAVFAISLVITGFIIPQILLIAFRKQLFDVPDERKIHQGAVPRLGGIAFMPSIILSISFLAGCYILNGNSDVINSFLINKLPEAFGLCSLLIMYLVGIADDLVGVKYRAKFAAQILSAIFIIAAGIYVSNLHGLFWIGTFHTVIAVIFTILLIVFITNAINLIDGIDGLASGLSSIACLFYGYFFIQAGDYFFSLVAFSTLGTLVPFFGYNVFGNAAKHKKIFMGDTGALTIGLLLSIMSIRLCNLPVTVSLPGNLLVLAFAPLMIPCLDVLRVYFRRLRNHRNPFLPDKTHIHHKFLALGMRQRYAMITILSISFLFTLANVLLSEVMNATMLFLLDLILWVLGNVWLTQAIKRREEARSNA